MSGSDGQSNHFSLNDVDTNGKPSDNSGLKLLYINSGFTSAVRNSSARFPCPQRFRNSIVSLGEKPGARISVVIAVPNVIPGEVSEANILSSCWPSGVYPPARIPPLRQSIRIILNESRNFSLMTAKDL